MRVVLDDQIRLSPESKLATTASDAPVLVVGRSGNPDLTAKGVEILSFDPLDLCSVLGELGRRSIQSVLVEGGATVARAFIDAGLVNKVSVFIAPKLVGGIDRMADALELQQVDVVQQGRDIEVTGYPAGQTT